MLLFQNETLELTYGVYVRKTLKRKLPEDQTVNIPTVPMLKKRRLPSATPQLQAFFSSHLNKPIPPAEKINKPQLDEGVTEKSDKKLLNFPEPCPEKFFEPLKNVSDVPASQSNNHKVSQKDVEQNEQAEKAKNNEEKTSAKQEEKKSAEKRYVFHEHKSAVKNKHESGRVNAPQPIPNKKPDVQCYQMLSIPVDEAMRSKPPTPVESPATVYSPPAKAKRPFVQLSSNQSSEIKPSKSRRKSSAPHHNVSILPAQPRSFAPVSLSQQPLSAPGNFILLGTNPSAKSSLVENHAATVSKPANNRAPVPSNEMSHAQAHRVALDAVRSMGNFSQDFHNAKIAAERRSVAKLSTDKRSAFSFKRPILPKTCSSSISIEKSSNEVPTRNIFQNEKVLYPMTSLSKPQEPQINKSPIFPNNISSQQDLVFKKVAASSTAPEKMGLPAPRKSFLPLYSAPNMANRLPLQPRQPAPGAGPSSSHLRFNLSGGRSKQPPIQPNRSSVWNGKDFNSTEIRAPFVSPTQSHAMAHGAPNTVALLKNSTPKRYPTSSRVPLYPKPPAPHKTLSNTMGVPFTPTSVRSIASSSNQTRNIGSIRGIAPNFADASPQHPVFTNPKPPAPAKINRRFPSFDSINQNHSRANLSPSRAHGLSSGVSGSIYTRSPLGTSSMSRPYLSNKPEAVGRSSGASLSLSRPPSSGNPRSFDRNKRNVLRNPTGVMTPPVGTKSPWSTRQHPFSPVVPPRQDCASIPTSSPPPAHQHFRSYPVSGKIASVSGENSEQPLELTSKSSTVMSHPASMALSDNSDLPLCLVVKKNSGD